MSVAQRTVHRLFIPEMHAFGGYERILVEMAIWMRQRGADFEVVCFRETLNLGKLVDVRVHQILPQGGSLIAKVMAFRRWGQSIKNEKTGPILISLQMPQYAAYSGMPNYYLRIADTPSLLGPKPKRSIKTILSDRAQVWGLKHAGGISTDANYQAEEFRRLWNVDAIVHRIGTRPVGETFKRKFPVTGAIHILSVCRVERSKRIDWIIAAAARIRENLRTDVHVDIVGTGSQVEALRTMADELGIASAVTFHGFVSDETLEELLNSTHVFAMPAKQGYGIPALEAMGHGSPTVLDVESGVSDILAEEPWAYISHGSKSSFEERLTQAVADVRDGKFDTLPAPDLPTWDGFFRELTDFCRWDVP